MPVCQNCCYQPGKILVAASRFKFLKIRIVNHRKTCRGAAFPNHRTIFNLLVVSLAVGFNVSILFVWFISKYTILVWYGGDVYSCLVLSVRRLGRFFFYTKKASPLVFELLVEVRKRFESMSLLGHTLWALITPALILRRPH